MSAGKWRVWRGHLRTGMAVWIAAPPLSGPLDLRAFLSHAEALAYAVEQAEAGR